MDQNSVDDLLAQVQAQTKELSDVAAGAAPATPATVAAVAAPPAKAPAEIPGDIEAPGGGPADPGVTGEFAPPPASLRNAGGSSDLGRLLAIEVPVIVQLGSRRMMVGEVMRLAVGAIIEFAKSAEDDLELLVNNKTIGRGHAVKVGENFGIKITNIGSVRETIRKLGGH